jgi:zinc transport system substrate-binding protein
MRHAFLPFALCAALLAAGPARAEAPKVVVSIAPVHSLVAGAMEGVGSPDLLVKGAASPHNYALKPSDARLLADAKVVFWIGEMLEAFLAKPLDALAGKATVVELVEAPGLQRLPYRSGGSWGDDGRDGHEPKAVAKGKPVPGHDHGHDHGDIDPHVWLSPANARVLAAAIVAALAEADPANAARYRENGRRMDARLADLETELRGILAPVKGRPFVVFHDAYQYLEHAFGLNAIGAIAASPERPPGPKGLAILRKRIVAARARCVFREPQFPAKLAGTVAEGTGAKVASLDPEGAALPPGADLYFDLMRTNARALVDCLGG